MRAALHNWDIPPPQSASGPQSSPLAAITANVERLMYGEKFFKVLLEGRTNGDNPEEAEILSELPELARGLVDEVTEREAVDLLLRAGEVAVNLEPFEVADDEQGWVVERLAILEELLVRGAEVLKVRKKKGGNSPDGTVARGSGEPLVVGEGRGSGAAGAGSAGGAQTSPPPSTPRWCRPRGTLRRQLELGRPLRKRRWRPWVEHAHVAQHLLGGAGFVTTATTRR